MAREDVERVREAIDIVELIGSTLDLRKAGKNYKALCPFHQEKTPSFYVFPETQSFYCFGCGASGDAITFVMRTEQLGFREALERLAERAGITLQSSRLHDHQEDEQRQRLFELNRLAAAWFAHVLWSTAFGEPARAYLERRGVDRATAERFGLGFAPDAPAALLRYLTQRGASSDELVQAGLVVRRDDGSLVDRFRNRVIFPIRDRQGRILGFGGRSLGDVQPKYLNSPQTPLFDKSSVLYALDLAEESIRAQRSAIVVEGYLDAITAHQFGYSNTVASLGTALTERQGKLLRRLADRILLALDADAAGRQATLRGLELLRTALADAERPVADPRQLVRFERTLGVELAVVVLPEGFDPDDLIRQDRPRWEAALARPVPLVDYYFDALLGSQPPAHPREAAALLERVAPLLLELGDPLQVDLYTRAVAHRLHLPEETVRRLLASYRRRPVKSSSSTNGQQPGQRPLTTEQQLIALLLRYPDAAAIFLEELDQDSLLDVRHREIVQALRSGVVGAETGWPDELTEYVAFLRERVAAQPDLPVPLARQALRDALRRLRRERHDERLRSLLSEVRVAEQTGDRAALRSALELIEALKQRFPEFYPERSPYFRDTRDPVT
ncbi:MAG: DNA primase [Thermomicrobium sp.]|nr:DNA primase [Thermomicrobium sp.]MDW8007344.1 DNA primase [Thermomicrobium sp.]